ncbi:MAG: YchJ family metal-binding protein [Actinomycetota bacterium]
MNCYCCSGKLFENCCRPFINGTTKPPTALALMRSRYSAYAIGDVEYLFRTTHSSTRRLHDPQAIKEWAESCFWQKLEIETTERGSIKDKRGMVEFRAFYLDVDQQLQIHHEYSNFVKEIGNWFFVDGKVAHT